MPARPSCSAAKGGQRPDNILGDDGVPVEYHERFWRSGSSTVIPLRQDAFDAIDANCPIRTGR